MTRILRSDFFKISIYFFGILWYNYKIIQLLTNKISRTVIKSKGIDHIMRANYHGITSKRRFGLFRIRLRTSYHGFSVNISKKERVIL